MEESARATLLSFKNNTSIEKSEPGKVNFFRGGSLKKKKSGIMSRMQSSTGLQQAKGSSKETESQPAQEEPKEARVVEERPGTSDPVSKREGNAKEGPSEKKSASNRYAYWCLLQQI